MQINWLSPLLAGFWLTLQFFFLTLILSLPLGLLGAVLRRKLIKTWAVILDVYVYVFRGTPLLLQMMFIYFGLPMMGLVVLDRFDAALVTLVLNYTAYFIEIFRGGIQAVPKGQFEAVKVLSIKPLQAWWHVILPQVWRITLPSIANEVITLIKDTSLIYVLGLDDLLKVGRGLSNQHATMLPYLYVGIIYLLFTGLASIILRKLEEKMGVAPNV